MFEDRPLPELTAESLEGLTLDSTLQELSLHNFQLKLSSPGRELAKAFDEDKRLPGAIVTEQNQFVGMISRRQFLEMLSRPYGIELFYKRPLSSLFPFVKTETSIYPGDLPILTAAQQCLQRSPDLRYEPLVVQINSRTYRLLDVHTLLIAHAKINELAMQLLRERTTALDRANAEIRSLNQQLTAENIRLNAEVEVTRRLQKMLLPQQPELDDINGLEIAGYMEPAAEIGGDYYDIIDRGDRVKIGIGDVTGHGLESGVLTIMVQTAVRTLLESNETDPKKFLDVLNRTIYHNVNRMNSDKNLTLSLLDYQQGILKLSGQHEQAIVLRAGGNIELIDTIDLGFPIGLDLNIAKFVAESRIQLNPGDSVVLYTDGITEAEDINGVQYGLETLCEVLRYSWQRSAEEIKQTVIDNLWQHIGSQKLYDDITLVVLKQK